MVEMFQYIYVGEGGRTSKQKAKLQHRFQVSRNVRDSHAILLDPAVTHKRSSCLLFVMDFL